MLVRHPKHHKLGPWASAPKGCLLALLLTMPARAQEPRLMSYDGTAMTLSVTGNELEIAYLEVPVALRELGVASGAPLVRGHWEGLMLVGEAYAFAPGCAPMPYPVRAVVDLSGSLVVIGPAPLSCSDRTLTWDRSAVMRFDPPPPARPVREKKATAEKPKPKVEKPKPKPKPAVRRQPAAPAPWAPYQQQYQWRW
jgi:hypothetical protein